MAKTLEDRTLALAGILQPIAQVQSIAREGKFDADCLETAVKSTLNTQPRTVMSLYGGIEGLKLGLSLISQQFEKKGGERSKDLLHYFIGVNQLQKKLAKDTSRLDRIASGIDSVERQTAHFSVTHETILARLADIYSTTLSDLSPRIMVQGESVYLSNPSHINRVRTLLLASIRAAVLWRQCGGGVMKLMFERKKLVEEAQRLLRTPEVYP